MQIPDRSLILIQGDSITDAGRDKQFDREGDLALRGRSLGSGYAMMISARLAADLPQRGLDVRNLGISGNRIVDLYARLKENGWVLKPAVLSILIGINDTWHEFKRGSGIELPRFEKVYRMVLTEMREQVPGLRFVLCEPFVLPCGECGPGWREDVDARRAVVRRLAGEFSAVVVPFQQVFDDACQRAPAAHWAGDGVHPSPAGHLLMARAWMEAVGLGA